MSAPTAPQPVLKKIPHRHRVVSSDREKGLRDDDEIREGIVRVEIKALNLEVASGPDQSDRTRRWKMYVPCAADRKNGRS